MNVNLNSHGRAVVQMCHLTAAWERENAWVPQSEISTSIPRSPSYLEPNTSFFPASSSLPYRGRNNICLAYFMLEIKGLVRALGKGSMLKTLFKGGFGPPCHFKCQARPMTFLAAPFNASDRPFLRRGSKGSMNPS